MIAMCFAATGLGAMSLARNKRRNGYVRFFRLRVAARLILDLRPDGKREQFDLESR